MSVVFQLNIKMLSYIGMYLKCRDSFVVAQDTKIAVIMGHRRTFTSCLSARSVELPFLEGAFARCQQCSVIIITWKLAAS